jgi:hypothetical protein
MMTPWLLTISGVFTVSLYSCPNSEFSFFFCFQALVSAVLSNLGRKETLASTFQSLLVWTAFWLFCASFAELVRTLLPTTQFFGYPCRCCSGPSQTKSQPKCRLCKGGNIENDNNRKNTFYCCSIGYQYKTKRLLKGSLLYSCTLLAGHLIKDRIKKEI